MRQIHKENNGVIGFEYDLNVRNKRSRKSIEIESDDPNPNKKQRTLPQVNTKPKAKTKPKKLPKTQILAPSWRWDKDRRKVAIQKATDCNLFNIKTTGGKRDQQIRVIVYNLNDMKDVDVNYLLLTEELYTKEIYRIQRKLERLSDEAAELLPEEEQLLFKQLLDSGHIAEARTAKVSADQSSVKFISLSVQS